MGQHRCDHCDCEHEDEKEEQECDCQHPESQEKVEALKKDIAGLGFGVEETEEGIRLTQ